MMNKLLVIVGMLIAGCSCGDQQNRMPSQNQGRDGHDRQGVDSGHYQPDYQQQPPMFPHQDMQQHQGMQSQGMSSQGMPPQGMSPQDMHSPCMPPQGMYMPPPQFRGRPGMPPHLMPPMENPIMVIKRLENELNAKDHEISNLKNLLNQQKQHQHH